jgi:3-oxoacyl-[acyl-carrier protein] reductase
MTQLLHPLSGKRALITGATGGIGQAIAKALHAQGAEVCLSGRKTDVLKELENQLQERCSVWKACLSETTELVQMVQTIEKEKGPIDILVNNGGVTQDQFAIRMSEQSFRDVLQTNLMSAFTLSKQVLRSMMKRKWGRIINISSVVAFSGNPGQSNYCASKAGLVGMTKAMALEMARYQVTVNAVAPGFIATAMTDAIPEDLAQTLIQKIPSGKMGAPEDVAYFVQTLAHPSASYMTGQTLHVNGGLWLS